MKRDPYKTRHHETSEGKGSCVIPKRVNGTQTHEQPNEHTHIIRLDYNSMATMSARNGIILPIS